MTIDASGAEKPSEAMTRMIQTSRTNKNVSIDSCLERRILERVLKVFTLLKGNGEIRAILSKYAGVGGDVYGLRFEFVRR
ncbi:unnamed protein product [Nippostrongylus brasiliensis]|uniref:Transcriptional regulator n=1 Tax=Nippostrongylus brasiliensis TaxID=27835 RepID=A0A0N4YA95_NIPBR|nr:unnamed protein product [Nippostrongylus brasiliensis]